jgi:hypothetical protein
LQSYSFYQIENEIVYKTFPDGTNEKIVIDGTTDIPALIQNFQNNLNPEKKIQIHQQWIVWLHLL